jgi:hypothetical protein
MVLISAQTTSFFENEDQMGIPNATVVQLATEGIISVIDLADFDKESLQQLADNLRRPGRARLQKSRIRLLAKRNNFRAAAIHLLPYDPVTKMRLNGTKRSWDDIFGVR